MEAGNTARSDPARNEAAEADQARSSPLPLTLLVAGTFFMENFDGTVLATAAPAMATTFGVDSAAIGVAITSYLLALAVFIPLSGWVTQRFGARLIFPAAIVVFTVASLLCALSTTLPQLVIVRALQGLGGAMMVPVGRLVVLRATDKRDLIRAIAWLTWPALTAPILAPLVGGLLVTYASWHWIFLINLPLGAIAFVAALKLVPRGSKEPVERLDWMGQVLTGIAIGALVWFASSMTGHSAPPAEVVGVGILAVVSGWLAIRHLRRAEHPLLDLRPLRVHTFRVTHAGGSIFRLTITAVPFLLPLLFQVSFGWSAVLAGFLVLFVFVGNLGIKPFTTPLLRRFGFRTVILGSTLGASLSMLLVMFVEPSTPHWMIAALLTFGGVVRSIGFTAYNTLAFADIPQEDLVGANTLSSTLGQVAAGLGVAVGALALSGGQLLFGSQTAPAAYHFAFIALGVLTLAATVEALFLHPEAADHLHTRRS